MTDLTASYLILHGIENHRPPGHWQFLLAAKLAELHHQVLYPGLPDPDQPRFDAWEQALLSGLAELDRSGNRVVICHSLACLLWFRAAPGIPDELRPDRLLLVAPPAVAHLPAPAADFAHGDLDGAAIRASVRTELLLVTSDDDPYNPPGEGQQDHATALGIPATVIPGAGHFTPDDGYGTWPFSLDWSLGR